MKNQTPEQNVNASAELKAWHKPVISQLDVSETANGMIGSDGNGGGSQQGGNSSGS